MSARKDPPLLLEILLEYYTLGSLYETERDHLLVSLAYILSVGRTVQRL